MSVINETKGLAELGGRHGNARGKSIESKIRRMKALQSKTRVLMGGPRGESTEISFLQQYAKYAKGRIASY